MDSCWAKKWEDYTGVDSAGAQHPTKAAYLEIKIEYLLARIDSLEVRLSVLDSLIIQSHRCFIRTDSLGGMVCRQCSSCHGKV